MLAEVNKNTIDKEEYLNLQKLINNNDAKIMHVDEDDDKFILHIQTTPTYRSYDRGSFYDYKLSQNILFEQSSLIKIFCKEIDIIKFDDLMTFIESECPYLKKYLDNRSNTIFNVKVNIPIYLKSDILTGTDFDLKLLMFKCFKICEQTSIGRILSLLYLCREFYYKEDELIIKTESMKKIMRKIKFSLYDLLGDFYRIIKKRSSELSHHDCRHTVKFSKELTIASMPNMLYYAQNAPDLNFINFLATF